MMMPMMIIKMRENGGNLSVEIHFYLPICNIPLLSQPLCHTFPSAFSIFGSKGSKRRDDNKLKIKYLNNKSNKSIRISLNYNKMYNVYPLVVLLYTTSGNVIFVWARGKALAPHPTKGFHK
jgi:hypothetical protein